MNTAAASTPNGGAGSSVRFFTGAGADVDPRWRAERADADADLGRRARNASRCGGGGDQWGEDLEFGDRGGGELLALADAGVSPAALRAGGGAAVCGRAAIAAVGAAAGRAAQLGP